MKVSVVYAGSHNQAWVDVDVDSEATVEEAIQRCGLLEKMPEIDTRTMKIGIFGKFTTLKQALKEGDRVEIYRRITRVLDEDDDDDDD
ncbi:RnfH family protein [Haliea sp. E17]|uniref:RnfH family protein n=1 Tax=Haliea sp. E17 TaxID=3401576 RepID=UPI003AAD1C38